MLNAAKKQIDKSLALFLARARKEYCLHLVNPILYESIREFSLRKGKRIRPLLLILSYLGFHKKNKTPSRKLYNASSCIELLHIFMLIHDDIIDRSNLRRGKPTMHRLLTKATKTKKKNKLGIDLAIVAGDIIYAMAIDSFLAIDEHPKRKEEALRYFIKTAGFTAVGEFIDILHGVEDISTVTEKDVFLSYTLKTARYTFSCPLAIGAILSGASKRQIALTEELGTLLGQAFQIQDDIIGVFGSEKSIGKSVLSDIEESKKTILICHSYRQLDAKGRHIFLNHFNKKNKTHKDLKAIRKILIETESLLYSLKKVEMLLKRAKHISQKLNMRPRYRRKIWNMMHSFFAKGVEIADSRNIPLSID